MEAQRKPRHGPAETQGHQTARRLTGDALAGMLVPLASGALLDRGWLPAQLYFFFSAPFVVAAVAIFLMGPARACNRAPCG
jgi:hypothetical protein